MSLLGLGVTVYRLNDKIPFVTDIRPAPTVTLFAVLFVFSGVVVGIVGHVLSARAALVLAALVLPLFLICGTGDLWELDYGVSARRAAQSAIDHLPPTELASATTYKLGRGLKFGLNFYLHRELAEWSPPTGHSSIVFTTPERTKDLEQMGVRCFHYLAFPAVEICADSSAIVASADRSSHRGQPH